MPTKAPKHAKGRGGGVGRPTVLETIHINWLGVEDVLSNVRLAWKRRKGPLEPKKIEKGTSDDLSGRVCIVTGGNAGVGKATAAALARRGGHVIVACRNPQRARAAVADLQTISPIQGCGNPKVESLALDLASLKDVRRFCEEYKNRGLPLDVLVCNAGVMTPPKRSLTADGHEVQWGVNHLGHWLLINSLMGTMGAAVPTSPRTRRRSKDAPSPKVRGVGGKARVVILTSVTHQYGRIDWEDPDGEHKPYAPFSAYGQSKLAGVMTARELQRRAGDSLTACAVHPGLVHTGLAHGFFDQWVPVPLRPLAHKLYPLTLRPADAAAEVVMYGVTAKEEEVGGQYILDSHVAPGAARSRDAHAAGRLWELTKEITGRA